MFNVQCTYRIVHAGQVDFAIDLNRYPECRDANYLRREIAGLILDYPAVNSATAPRYSDDLVTFSVLGSVNMEGRL